MLTIQKGLLRKPTQLHYFQNLFFDHSVSAEDWSGNVWRRFPTFQYLSNNLFVNLVSVVVPIMVNDSLKVTPIVIFIVDFNF